MKGKHGAGHTGYKGRSSSRTNAASTTKTGTNYSGTHEKQPSRTGAVACASTNDPNKPHNMTPYGAMPG